MTDEQIIEAWDSCQWAHTQKDNFDECGYCPFNGKNECESKMEKAQHDLAVKLKVENTRLKAENATLCERFSALNKMPCNIGDTVYVLFGYCYRCEDDEGDHCSCEKRGKDKIFEMKVGSVRFDKDDYYLYEDPIGITSGLSCSGRNYGKTWFLSMEEAKNHLMIS